MEIDYVLYICKIHINELYCHDNSITMLVYDQNRLCLANSSFTFSTYNFCKLHFFTFFSLKIVNFFILYIISINSFILSPLKTIYQMANTSKTSCYNVIFTLWTMIPLNRACDFHMHYNFCYKYFTQYETCVW